MCNKSDLLVQVVQIKCNIDRTSKTGGNGVWHHVAIGRISKKIEVTGYGIHLIEGLEGNGAGYT